MRTTLDVDEDVLVAEELARHQRKMAGKLASELMTAASGRHGFPPIQAGRSPVSNELINEMRDELGV